MGTVGKRFAAGANTVAASSWALGAKGIQNKLKTFHWTFAMIAATSGIFAISLSSRERVCGPQHVGIIHGYSASKSLHADFITEHVSVSV